MTRILIEDFRSATTWARPGDSFMVRVELSADASVDADVSIALLDEDREVHRIRREVRLHDGSATLEASLTLPPARRRGYGLRLEVRVGGTSSTATSVIEALEGWWESPRHAAITRYEEPAAAARSARDLAAWHVTVVQHYDWMWRHYRYLPPDGADPFEDALGRMVSHNAMRASIEAGHRVGIASLAYGSVYGAEPEYVAEHLDERVFDDDGEPLSLGGTFSINDVRPGSSWRHRLLGEYEASLQAFPFDGIHMDTYGPPHTATAADGSRLDFAALYPGLIDDAAARVSSAHPGARVLFNCVEGFPLDAIAPAAAACLYLELWPPDRTFADVVRWVDRARALADGRQIVIAAYAATLREPEGVTDRAEAAEAVLLLGSVIIAAGAYHHTLAEDDRLLVEGYYPAAVHMQPGEIDALRALWRFSARYVHLLSDPAAVAVDPGGLSIIDEHGQPVEWSREPYAGVIWVRASQLPDGRRVIHLIDLQCQPDGDWDAPKRVSRLARGLSLAWPGLQDAIAASPWSEEGDAIPIRSDGLGWRLPELQRWLMVMEGRESERLDGHDQDVRAVVHQDVQEQ